MYIRPFAIASIAKVCGTDSHASIDGEVQGMLQGLE
jgi:hypothetical protein